MCKEGAVTQRWVLLQHLPVMSGENNEKKTVLGEARTKNFTVNAGDAAVRTT